MGAREGDTREVSCPVVSCVSPRAPTTTTSLQRKPFFVPKVAVVESFERIHKLKKPNQTKDTQITNGLIHLLA